MMKKNTKAFGVSKRLSQREQILLILAQTGSVGTTMDSLIKLFRTTRKSMQNQISKLRQQGYLIFSSVVQGNPEKCRYVLTPESIRLADDYFKNKYGETFIANLLQDFLREKGGDQKKKNPPMNIPPCDPIFQKEMKEADEMDNTTLWIVILIIVAVFFLTGK